MCVCVCVCAHTRAHVCMCVCVCVRACVCVCFVLLCFYWGFCLVGWFVLFPCLFFLPILIRCFNCLPGEMYSYTHEHQHNGNTESYNE